METLSIGKPVIGSRIGGIPELIQDNFNGFVYKYDDVDELVSKIKILFENNELAEQMGKNAKESAIKLYNIYANNKRRRIKWKIITH